MEKLVDFSIAKQKIIKTDELFKLYVKKNEEFEKTQKICKTLKSKYEDIKNELKITKLKSENLVHRSQLAETKYLPLKDEYDKLKLEFAEFQKDTHLTINDLQVKYQSANQELVECQEELSKKSEEKVQKTENKGKRKKCPLEQQLMNDELEMISKTNRELLEENSKLKDDMEKLKIQVNNIPKDTNNEELGQISQIKLELNRKDFELKQLKKSHETLKEDKLKEIHQLQTKLTKFNHVKSNLESIQEKYNALKLEMSLLQSSQEETLRDLMKIKDSEQRLIEENLRLKEINSEPTGPPIEDIRRELCPPRIISPFSSDDDNAVTIDTDNNYHQEMIDDKVENIEHILENNLLSQRRKAKFERFKRKQKLVRCRNLKRKAPKIDLLSTLIQLKNANINFTISNESILEPIPNNSNFVFSTSNKLNSCTAKKHIYKKKLKCGTSNCVNSYMLLSGKNKDEENANLLGFFEVKSEPFSRSNSRIEDSNLNSLTKKNKSSRNISKQCLNNSADNDSFDDGHKSPIPVINYDGGENRESEGADNSAFEEHPEIVPAFNYEAEENHEESEGVDNSTFEEYPETHKVEETKQEERDLIKSKTSNFKVEKSVRKKKEKLSLKQRLLKRTRLLARNKPASLLKYSSEARVKVKVNKTNTNPILFTETENIDLAKEISLEASGCSLNHNLGCNDAVETKPQKRKRSENSHGKTEAVLELNDGNDLHKRSEESDCEEKVTRLKIKPAVKSPRSSYKRPICRTRQSLRLLAKSPQTQTKSNASLSNNEGEFESPVSPPQSPGPEEMADENAAPFIIPLEKIEEKAVEKMATTRMDMLISELLNFGNSEEIVNNIVQEFVSQEPEYIAMAMLETVAQDFVDKPTLHSTNFAVVTTTQSILLGFMSKLEKRGVEVYKSFLKIAENRILTSKLLEEIDPISRLYLSVCKIQQNITRVRRFCCDVFFHCGDLAVPFLFAVLPSWTDIFPHAAHSEEQPLVRVIVQIVHLKQCIKPGYNLMQLKNLLNKYYMYPTERWDSEELFQEMFCRYLKNPARITSMPLFLLCKNHPEKWVMEKIDQKFKPIIDQIPTENFKATVIILVGNLSCKFSSKSVPNYLPGIRTWLESLVNDTTPDLVKRSVEFALKKLSKK